MLSSFVVVVLFVVFSSVVSFSSVFAVVFIVVGFCVVFGSSGMAASSVGLAFMSSGSSDSTGSVICVFFVVSSNFVVTGFSVGGSSSGSIHG